MSEPGKAMMGTATAAGPDRQPPPGRRGLPAAGSTSSARGVLVLIAANRASFGLSEAAT